jgi:hypothetical protein
VFAGRFEVAQHRLDAYALEVVNRFSPRLSHGRWPENA